LQLKQTRRQFIQAAALATPLAVGSAGTDLKQRPQPQTRWSFGKSPLKLGLASYTLRKFTLDETLVMTQRLALKHLKLKSFHLPLDSKPEEIKAVIAKITKAQIKLYGGGVIYMENEAHLNQAFEYAKKSGMSTIVGVPSTELLGLVDKKVRQYDIKVAIHNHGPGDEFYPTPDSVYDKIAPLDKRIGLCIDIGHTQRAGINPCESIQNFADRLLDVDLKDVTSPTAAGKAVEIGRGVVDVPAVLSALLAVGYSGIVAFEYEKDADNPLAGLAESVGYIRGVLAAI
jgi:sugar phosphate isomerase/epimerase